MMTLQDRRRTDSKNFHISFADPEKLSSALRPFYHTMAQQPIVIVGAGIAGLTLGRCLKQKGISTVLLERYTQSPRHTYGIIREAVPRFYEARCFSSPKCTYGGTCWQCHIRNSTCRMEGNDVLYISSVRQCARLHSVRGNLCQGRYQALLACYPFINFTPYHTNTSRSSHSKKAKSKKQM